MCFEYKRIKADPNSRNFSVFLLAALLLRDKTETNSVGLHREGPLRDLFGHTLGLNKSFGVIYPWNRILG